MAELKQGKVTDLGTVAPSTQVVTPATSAGPNIASILGGVAAEGYKQYSFYKADEESRDIVSTLNNDLQDIENGANLTEKLSNELGAYADRDPRITGLESQLAKLEGGAKQRQQAKLLYTLRAEAALKTSVARAPGLRREIAQVASRNFGFDPTSATVSMLLKNIDSEWAALRAPKTTEDPYKWQAQDMFKRAQSFSLTDAELDPHDYKGSFERNSALVTEYSGYQAQLDDVTNSLKQNKLDEGEAVATFSNLMRKSSGMQVRAIASTFGNIASEITTDDGLKTYMTELKPRLEALKAQIKANIDSSFGGLPLSPEGRELADKQSELLQGALTDGLSAILDSTSVTQAQQRVQFLSVLQSNWGLDFVEANQSMSVLNKMMPNIIPTITGMTLINSPDKLADVKGQILQGLATADPKQLRAANMKGLLNVLYDQTAFEGQSKEEKRATLNAGLSLLDQAQEDHKAGVKYSTTEMDHLSNVVAASAQLSSQFVDSDWVRVAKTVSKPVVVDMVNQLNAGNADQKVKAAILADSSLDAMQKYLTLETPRLINKPVAAFAERPKFSVDLKTGMMSFTVDNPANKDADIRLGRHSQLGERYRYAYNLGITTIVDTNNMVDSIMALKDHDPSLANLSRGQVLYMLAGDGLRAAGVKLLGEMEPLPDLKLEPAPKKTSAEDVLQQLITFTENTNLGLQKEEMTPEARELATQLGSISTDREALYKIQQLLSTKSNSLKGR